MKNTENRHKNTSKDESQEPTVFDLGERTISNQGFSKIVALPKIGITNCGCNLEDNLKVKVQLVQQGNEKYLKLVPVCNTNTDKQKKVDKE